MKKKNNNFIKNDFGIAIKHACISCKYFVASGRVMTGETARTRKGKCKCEFDGTSCTRDEICQAYQMHERYHKIGSTEKSLIHTREYMLFVQAHLDEANAYIADFREKHKDDKKMLECCPEIIEFINIKWRECYGNKSKFINA